MNGQRESIIFLPGAGGSMRELSVFRAGAEDTTDIQGVEYPRWQRYGSHGFSADGLVQDLVNEIEARVPYGPIRVIGISLGGHFAYAVALRLQQMGREVAGVCIIDAFMIESSAPSSGWQGRAASEFVELLRKCDVDGISRFLRSRFWRLLLRLAGKRLPAIVRVFAKSRVAAWMVSFDPILEGELTMRLLIRTVAPWLAALDRPARALDAPAIFLRTGRTEANDAPWRLRCPQIKIYEVPGHHHSLFTAENIDTFHQVFVKATEEWRRDFHTSDQGDLREVYEVNLSTDRELYAHYRS